MGNDFKVPAHRSQNVCISDAHSTDETPQKHGIVRVGSVEWKLKEASDDSSLVELRLPMKTNQRA